MLWGVRAARLVLLAVARGLAALAPVTLVVLVMFAVLAALAVPLGNRSASRTSGATRAGKWRQRC